MRVSSRSHDINADPMTVWMVLTDLARYPEWHPRITYAAGDVTPGGSIQRQETPGCRGGGQPRAFLGLACGLALAVRPAGSAEARAQDTRCDLVVKWLR